MLTLLAPAVLLPAALAAARRPGCRPGAVPLLAEGAAFAAFLLALAGAGALAFGLVQAGSLSVGRGAFALVLRVDGLSVTMALLVGFIGWVVVRFARSYLDGAAREGRFHALMLATLAAVLVLVHSGSLPVLVAAFVAVNATLHRLLLFFP